MKICFLQVGRETAFSKMMIASCKKTMPGVPIIQLRNQKTKQIKGVNGSFVLPFADNNLMVYRLQHYANLPPDHYLFLDTDVIVQKDCRFIDKFKFDVAAYRRKELIAKGFLERGDFPEFEGKNVAEMMPYNTGVIFSHNQRFWRDAYEYCLQLDPRYQRWFGDQIAFAHTVGKYRCMDLEEVFNYTPRHAAEDLRDKYIIHYKGGRKKWMKIKHPT